jgi:hypothetical protein
VVGAQILFGPDLCFELLYNLTTFVQLMYVPRSCNRVAHRLVSEGVAIQNSSIIMWPTFRTL